MSRHSVGLCLMLPPIPMSLSPPSLWHVNTQISHAASQCILEIAPDLVYYSKWQHERIIIHPELFILFFQATVTMMKMMIKRFGCAQLILPRSMFTCKNCWVQWVTVQMRVFTLESLRQKQQQQHQASHCLLYWFWNIHHRVIVYHINVCSNTAQRV